MKECSKWKEYIQRRRIDTERKKVVSQPKIETFKPVANFSITSALPANQSKCTKPYPSSKSHITVSSDSLLQIISMCECGSNNKQHDSYNRLHFYPHSVRFLLLHPFRFDSFFSFFFYSLSGATTERKNCWNHFDDGIDARARVWYSIKIYYLNNQQPSHNRTANEYEQNVMNEK